MSASNPRPHGDELARARAFIAAVEPRFRFARSVPEAPHWYLVRARLDPDLQEEFDWFADLIERVGYKGWFWHQEWTYVDVDGWKFWTSKEWYGEPGGRMLNRAHIHGEER